MSSNRLIALSELTDGSPITYGVVKPGDTPSEEGVRFIRGGDIKAGSIDSVSLRKISQDVSNQYKRTLLRGGELLVSLVGNPGEVAIVPRELAGANIARQVGLVRLNESSVNKLYVQYYLRSPQGKSELAANSLGSVQSVINLKELKKVEIPLPEREVQDRIAEILSTLEGKIQLNHEINQVLEQMAQAIFKSWFIDFEPVKAKITAKQRWLARQPGNEPASPVCYSAELIPETLQHDLETTMTLAAMEAISGKDEAQLTDLQAEQPEQYAELRATAELFPSAVQDSELGEIPEGWSVSALSGLAEITMGQSPKGETYNFEKQGAPLVNGPVEFGEHHPEKVKWTTAPSKLSGKNDLIVCVRGSTTGRFVKSNDVYCLGRGVCSISSDAFQPFIDRLFTEELPALLSLTTGSTFPSWSGPTLKNYRILVPQSDLLETYCALFAPVDAAISTRVKESSELTAIRDTLLPKLLSGELSVSAAESQPTQAESASSAACKAL